MLVATAGPLPVLALAGLLGGLQASLHEVLWSTSLTARQAGGAIGIAAFGAIAGGAAQATTFMAGLHTDALIAVGLWLAVTAATFALVPGVTRPGACR